MHVRQPKEWNINAVMRQNLNIEPKSSEAELEPHFAVHAYFLMEGIIFVEYTITKFSSKPCSSLCFFCLDGSDAKFATELRSTGNHFINYKGNDPWRCFPSSAQKKRLGISAHCLWFCSLGAIIKCAKEEFAEVSAIWKWDANFFFSLSSFER